MSKDLIDRQAAIDEADEWLEFLDGDKDAGTRMGIKVMKKSLRKLPSVQPEQKTCEGCKHSGQWENELEYGASCPCLACKRRASDNYERSD